jgi:hypothetical protein
MMMNEDEKNGLEVEKKNAQATAEDPRPGPLPRGAGGDLLLSDLGAPLPPATRLGGRPVVITAEVADQLCLLLSVGLSRRQAATYLGIDSSTITRTATRDAELAHRLRCAEELCLAQPLMTLFGESRKNWKAAAWLLDHKRKHPGPLSAEEKAERDAERIADARREQEVCRQLDLIEEEAREAERARREAKARAKRLAEIEAEHGGRQRSR